VLSIGGTEGIYDELMTSLGLLQERFIGWKRFREDDMEE